MARKFIIDTDTASDDAVALVMALRWHAVQVEAITVVAGNVPVEMGARNALYTAQMCGSHARWCANTRTPPGFTGATAWAT